MVCKFLFVSFNGTRCFEPSETQSIHLCKDVSMSIYGNHKILKTDSPNDAKF